jgi:hypothetical protein
MAIGTTAAIIGGVTAATNAIGALTKKDPKFDTTGLQNTQMGGGSSYGMLGSQAANQGLNSLTGLQNDQSFQANQDLAGLFQQYSQGGYLPNAQDTATAQAFAQSQFDPRRVAMNQAFQDQLTQANRSAALVGRSQNDPILRAKLAQEQTRQQAQLASEQNAFAQQFAMQQPMQRLQFAEGRANVLNQNFAQQMGLSQNILQSGLAAQGQDFQQRLGQYQADLQKQSIIAQGKFAQEQAETSFGEKLAGATNNALGAIGGVAKSMPALNSLFGGKK